MVENFVRGVQSTCAGGVKEQLRRAEIEIKASRIHRYGVFADEFILPGEVIEECPVIVCDDGCAAIKNYVFNWQEDAKSAVALGCGSIYNHSPQPNARFETDPASQTITFTAIKPIRRGEEILVNYGDDWLKARVLGAGKKFTKSRRKSVMRIIFLSLFFLAIYLFMPTTAKDHAHSAQTVTSAAHQ